jgi:hypothetical protein
MKIMNESVPEGMREEFSVWVFLPDETYFAEARWIGAEASVKLARELTLRPAAKVGLINRVLITDGGDFSVFEWVYGKGVTFPPLASPC